MLLLSILLLWSQIWSQITGLKSGKQICISKMKTTKRKKQWQKANGGDRDEVRLWKGALGKVSAYSNFKKNRINHNTKTGVVESLLCCVNQLAVPYLHKYNRLSLLSIWQHEHYRAGTEPGHTRSKLIVSKLEHCTVLSDQSDLYTYMVQIVLAFIPVHWNSVASCVWCKSHM
jgi:hypothetical protein